MQKLFELNKIPFQLVLPCNAKRREKEEENGTCRARDRETDFPPKRRRIRLFRPSRSVDCSSALHPSMRAVDNRTRGRWVSQTRRGATICSFPPYPPPPPLLRTQSTCLTFPTQPPLVFGANHAMCLSLEYKVCPRFQNCYCGE